MKEKKPREKEEEPSSVVTFDSDWIINKLPHGDEKKVRWDDLQAIYFESKVNNSIQEEIVLFLETGDSHPVLQILESTQGAFEFISEILDRFPDLDYDQYLDAISSRENKKYLIWKAKT